MGSTQPGCDCTAVALAAPARAAEPAAHSAVRDWALPKTLSVTSGLSGPDTAGAALAIELVARLIATATEATERTEPETFIDTPYATNC